MWDRWRHNRHVETFVGAFTVAAGACVAVAVVAALLVGFAVLVARIAGVT